MKLYSLALVSALSLSIHSMLFSDDGALDPSFGTGGVSIINTETEENRIASKTAIHSNGSIVGSVFGLGFNANETVFRNDTIYHLLNTSGQLQTSVANIFGRPSAGALGIALQSDDKAVFAGYTTTGADSGNFVVARINLNGTPDNSFGANGVALPFPSTAGNRFTLFGGANGQIGLMSQYVGCAIQADGKIVISGTDESQIFFVVIRLNADGSIDRDFGTNGFASVTVGNEDNPTSGAMTLALQPDGKILVGGTANSNSLAVARLLPNGHLDTATFNKDRTMGNRPGISVIPFAPSATALSIVVLAGGKIMVGGPVDTQAFAVVRLLADGTFDNTYGVGGSGIARIVGLTSNFSDVPFGGQMIVQPDGKALAAFDTPNVPNAQALIGRLNQNGSANDNDFGTNGIAIINQLALTQGLALQQDGKIVVAGGAFVGANTTSFPSYARLQNSITLAPTLVTSPIPTAFPAGTLFSGTAQALSTVDLVIDGTVQAGAWTAENGSWSIALPAALTVGTHTIKFVARHAAGNVNIGSNTIIVTVPSPQPPKVTNRLGAFIFSFYCDENVIIE